MSGNFLQRFQAAVLSEACCSFLRQWIFDNCLSAPSEVFSRFTRMRGRRWQLWCHWLIKPECRLRLQINRNADGCNTRLPGVSFNFASCTGCTQLQPLELEETSPCSWDAHLTGAAHHTNCSEALEKQGGRRASRLTTKCLHFFLPSVPYPVTPSGIAVSFCHPACYWSSFSSVLGLPQVSLPLAQQAWASATKGFSLLSSDLLFKMKF